MDRHVRGIRNGVDGEKAVRVFAMGDNTWREADGWPLPGTRPMALYLSAAEGPGPHALVDAASAVRAGAGSFVSDPADPVVDPFAAESGAHDYRDLPRRKDVLTFETRPLPSDLAVIGSITAEIHLSADAPDTDLWVKLFDVAPDGTAFNVMSPGLDLLRASYRDGGPERKLLVPGRVETLRFENLRTGNVFRRGHRVRVVLAASFFPHFSRNLHTGELETTSAASRRATLHVHHTPERPSRIVLPVLDAGQRTAVPSPGVRTAP
jgi:hypothetical protein